MAIERERGISVSSAVMSFEHEGLAFHLLNYQTIAALVNQIPVDTWDVLREVKQRRPAMMLSELIDCRRRTLQHQEAP